ncbi:MAG: VCBS repeat-containing protein [Planctomycetota bacterium]|jgi:hypothetical protein
MTNARCRRVRSVPTVLLAAAILLSGSHAAAQTATLPGEVESHVKLGENQGGFFGTIGAGDEFGEGLAALGDVDGDGIADVAVATPKADDGGIDRGAVWILFLAADGSARDWQKISSTDGGLLSSIDDGDRFGASIAPLGDWDGDGVPDIVVGASRDDDGGTDRGGVYMLMLHADGTVKSETKISGTQGGFADPLDDDDFFGSSVVCLGDLDGDDTPDLAVSSVDDDDGGSNRGAVFVLFMSPDGTVREHSKISDTSGGLRVMLKDEQHFGWALAALGDLDGDGRPDLAVSSPHDKEVSSARGAVFVLFLDADGSVRETQKISASHGGFTGTLGVIDMFGDSLAGLGDLDHDGVRDLAVGTPYDDDSDPVPVGYGNARGAVYILFLRKDGWVKRHQKISDTQGNFQGVLHDYGGFGEGLAGLGDFDGDGVVDLAVGSIYDSFGYGAPLTGAFWLLRLHASRWIDLGGALPGAAGAPALSGIGTLLGGEEVRLALRRGASFAPVAVALGSGAFVLPGEPIGPPPEVVIPGLATDASGAAEFVFRWPTGLPPGTTFFVQAWLPSSIPSGNITASNMLRATAP